MKRWIVIFSGLIMATSFLLIWVSRYVVAHPRAWWSDYLLWLGIVAPAVVSFVASLNDILQIIDRLLQSRTRKDDFQQELGDYLKWLRKRYSRLNLRGIEERHQKIHRLTLDDVYVSLSVVLDPESDQTSPNREQAAYRRTLTDMRDLLAENRCLAIVGGPGTGKTTFLHVIASTIAYALNSGDTEKAESILGLRAPLPIPVLVPLSEYNQYRRKRWANSSHSVHTLRSYVATHLLKDEVGLSSDFFEKLLESSHSCLLMLDGLDEVANEDERVMVREAVENLADTGGIERIVVTSRTHAYYGQSRLADFRVAFVQTMTPEQVGWLVERWTNAVYDEDNKQRESERRDLQRAISRLEVMRARLNQSPLIDTPLMVTIVAIVHYNQHHLPEHRAELYEKCVDVLLAEKTDRPQEVRTELTRLGGTISEKRQLLAYLAYRMMLSGEDEGRAVDESQMTAWLLPKMAQLYSREVAEPRMHSFITAIRERGSLVAERNGIYSFVHLTFQEYLAAYYLAENIRSVSGILEQLAEKDRAAGGWWSETVLLLVGYLRQRNSDLALEIVRRLAQVGSTPRAQLKAAVLAADAFIELEQDQDFTRSEVRQRLETLVDNPELITAGPERAQAGIALARLGDERPGVGVCATPVSRMKPPLQPLPDIRFCYVPAGPFEMGEGDEAHLNTCLDQPYWIGLYPITDEQFNCFVQAGGYGEPSYWDEAIRNGFWHEGLVKGYNDVEARREPARFPELFRTPNHPVVGVSWYEAQAYARWLTSVLPLPDGWRVQLPSEAEWEKAARGGLDIPQTPCVANWQQVLAQLQPAAAMRSNPLPTRRYVWGNEHPTHDEANCDRATSCTCSVGVYPKNESPYGVRDMLGNVWEWTRSSVGAPYPYCSDEREDPKLVTNKTAIRMRGGAWWEGPERCACFARYGNFPYRGDSGIGFRVVLCAGTSGNDNTEDSNLCHKPVLSCGLVGRRRPIDRQATRTS